MSTNCLLPLHTSYHHGPAYSPHWLQSARYHCYVGRNGRRGQTGKGQTGERGYTGNTGLQGGQGGSLIALPDLHLELQPYV